MRHFGRRKSTASQGDIDISPLIDMVFILLIFFMVSTTFVKDAKVDLNRPNAASAERASLVRSRAALSHTQQCTPRRPEYTNSSSLKPKSSRRLASSTLTTAAMNGQQTGWQRNWHTLMRGAAASAVWSVGMTQLLRG